MALNAIWNLSISLAAGAIVYQWTQEKRSSKSTVSRNTTGVDEFFDTPDGKKLIAVEPTEDDLRKWMSSIED
jgi:hypothetical protein